MLLGDKVIYLKIYFLKVIKLKFILSWSFLFSKRTNRNSFDRGSSFVILMLSSCIFENYFQSKLIFYKGSPFQSFIVEVQNFLEVKIVYTIGKTKSI